MLNDAQQTAFVFYVLVMVAILTLFASLTRGHLDGRPPTPTSAMVATRTATPTTGPTPTSVGYFSCAVVYDKRGVQIERCGDSVNVYVNHGH